MTVARPRHVVAAPDVDTALRALRARGMRISAARRQVVEGLFAARGPVSAEDLATGLGGARSPIDPAAVYGNLATLETLGLVRHVHLGHGPGKWMLADRTRSEFLHCERCGASLAVEPSRLDAARDAVRDATGYEPHFSHFPIVGLCPDCAGKSTSG